VNILVDLAHPAHFHFFSPAINRWRLEDHKVVVTARRKDVLLDLLKEAGEEAHVISGVRNGRIGQATELLQRIRSLIPIIRTNEIEVLTAVGGVSVSHAARLSGRPSLIWTNNENARLSNNITLPFASCVATPTSFIGNWGTKHRRYRGNHERAYIPRDFGKPDRGVLSEWGLDPDRPFSLVRLVSWQASHDKGHHGLIEDDVKRLTIHLEQYGQVALSIEGECPEIFEKWVRPIPPSRMREAIALASCYIGEGATMASEAALMGVPNICFSTIRLGYLEELESKFGLVRCISDLDQALGQIDKWFADPHLTSTFQQKRERFYEETDPVDELLHDWVLELAG